MATKALAILALAAHAEAMGQVTVETYDLEVIEEILENVEAMVYNDTENPVAPMGTTTLGHGIDPDDFSVLDD